MDYLSFTRDAYINSPSPIERELNLIFNSQSKLVIFDIGSCEGEDSIRYAKIFPNSKIFAFEPLQSNISLIEKNIQKYSVENIEILPIALSNKNGVEDFFVSSGQIDGKQHNQDWDYGNKSSSLLPPEKHLETLPWLKFNEVVKVQTKTLKSICVERNINSIDFIHMDVQGAELKVLEGAEEFIKVMKLIWLEVEAIELYKGQPLKSDVEKFMKKNGFYKLKDTVNHISGDQLYINRKHMFSDWKILSNSIAVSYRSFLQRLKFRKLLPKKRILINK